MLPAKLDDVTKHQLTFACACVIPDLKCVHKKPKIYDGKIVSLESHFYLFSIIDEFKSIFITRNCIRPLLFHQTTHFQLIKKGTHSQ